jgi:hypothetical protein
MLLEERKGLNLVCTFLMLSFEVVRNHYEIQHYQKVNHIHRKHTKNLCRQVQRQDL